MELLFLLILAAIGGNLAANLMKGKAAKTPNQTDQGSANRVANWWNTRFRRQGRKVSLRAWSQGAGEAHLPDDFKTWLKQLSPAEAHAFEGTLAEYTNGLGFKLHDLTAGHIDNRARMQVFVEAIVVYSQEYRKLKDAQKKAPKDQDAEKPENGAADGKQVAEKRASRRKRRDAKAPTDLGVDASEAAAA
ncbi:MAG TPA: hypothetical protein VLS48_07945 [Anaerolineales bacterium]|nr:hypothetical protein [Anaerolineales bacterium]